MDFVTLMMLVIKYDPIKQKECVGIRFKSHNYYDQEPFVKLSGFINTLFVHEFTFNNGLSSYYID